MTKRAVELSLNTIIIAAIALLVLIVLIIIFTGQSGKFTRGLNDCVARGGNGGDCTDTNAECVAAGGIPNGDCIIYSSDGKPAESVKNKVCCVFKK